MAVAALEPSIWHVAVRDEAQERRLISELGVHPLVAAVLVRRGWSDPAAAAEFLDPRLENLHNPLLLPDCAEAVKEILGAKERGETVYVHGDYDVDGVTSAALFTRFLTRIGCTVVPHVPHRMKEGYGIHLDAVKWAAESGAKLFLTCDCGVSAHEQVDAAREAGMRVVVTDHHEVGDTLPSASAVVNPHRHDSTYPFPDLAGVGVVFKVCAALTEELGHRLDQFYRAYLDLAVLGTVADVMPLVGENRVIARHGLERLPETRKAGLQALLRVSDLAGQRVTARNIGFQLGPRINAVGRIDDSALALDLLLTDEAAEADRLARLLDQHNTERRAEQQRTFEEAAERAVEAGLNQAHAIVISGEGWNPGIIGIVAGKLAEKFRRPTFVVALDSERKARGSARSIPGYNLAEAVRAAMPVLISGGGHEMAAGFSLDPANLEAFAQSVQDHASAALKAEDFVPRLEVDAEVEPIQADAPGAGALKALEPFGQGNQEPLFVCRGVTLSSVTATSKPEHVRVLLDTDAGPRAAMAFGIGESVSAMKPGTRVDVAFRMEESEFNGRAQFRWLLSDVQPSES